MKEWFFQHVLHWPVMPEFNESSDTMIDRMRRAQQLEYTKQQLKQQDEYLRRYREEAMKHQAIIDAHRERNHVYPGYGFLSNKQDLNPRIPVKRDDGSWE